VTGDDRDPAGATRPTGERAAVPAAIGSGSLVGMLTHGAATTWRPGADCLAGISQRRSAEAVDDVPDSSRHSVCASARPPEAPRTSGAGPHVDQRRRTTPVAPAVPGSTIACRSHITPARALAHSGCRRPTPPRTPLPVRTPARAPVAARWAFSRSASNARVSSLICVRPSIPQCAVRWSSR